MLYTTSASNRKTRRRRRSPNFPVFAIWAALVATDAFLQSHTQATLPPAASIAALAPAVAPTPLSLTALVREPLLMTFTTLANSPTRPACFRARTSTLPRPEPIPRPTRRLACLAPSAGLMLLSSMIYLSVDFDQIADLVNHAAHFGRILQFAHAVELAQTQATNGGAVRFLGANRAAHQLNLDGLLRCHFQAPVQAKMSSTVLPRLAATFDGVVELTSASNVARTML